MATEVIARQLPEAAGWRRPYLIAVGIGWIVVDVFDGLFVAEETPEHWLEAGWWAAATLVYLVLARRRPLPAAQRLGDWVIAGAMVLFGAMMALRATLPDALATRWSLLLSAAFCAAMLLLRRRRVRDARQPQPDTGSG